MESNTHMRAHTHRNLKVASAVGGRAGGKFQVSLILELKLCDIMPWRTLAPCHCLYRC